MMFKKMLRLYEKLLAQRLFEILQLQIQGKNNGLLPYYGN